MTNYEIFKKGWENGWASKNDMQDAVTYEIITSEEYKDITGFDFQSNNE